MELFYCCPDNLHLFWENYFNHKTTISSSHSTKWLILWPIGLHCHCNTLGWHTSGGSRISRGGRRPRGGRWLLRHEWQLRFENFVCRNERIWTLRGCALGTPPRSANEYYTWLMLCTCNCHCKHFSFFPKFKLGWKFRQIHLICLISLPK